MGLKQNFLIIKIRPFYSTHGFMYSLELYALEQNSISFPHVLDVDPKDANWPYENYSKSSLDHSFFCQEVGPNNERIDVK